jgi:predicted DCC family thiol-disulfide oxidoreductase YuxK
LQNPIILFDGVCNLCNGSVKFILKRDEAGLFRFAPLQSQAGHAEQKRLGLDADAMPSVVLVEGDRSSIRSTAALRIARLLGWPYKVLYPLILLPKPLRDLGYDLIAANRYLIFGKRGACMLPTPETRARFLNGSDKESPWKS